MGYIPILPIFTNLTRWSSALFGAEQEAIRDALIGDLDEGDVDDNTFDLSNLTETHGMSFLTLQANDLRNVLATAYDEETTVVIAEVQIAHAAILRSVDLRWQWTAIAPAGIDDLTYMRLDLLANIKDTEDDEDYVSKFNAPLDILTLDASTTRSVNSVDSAPSFIPGAVPAGTRLRLVVRLFQVTNDPPALQGVNFDELAATVQLSYEHTMLAP